MVIILALCIPLSFIAGGFVAYKGVQLGLRWQTEKEPTMPNPISEMVHKKQNKKAETEQDNILNEWLNGEG